MVNEETIKTIKENVLDRLAEIMFHKCFVEDSDMQKWDSGCWFRYRLFEQALEEARNEI